jgi:branched-chain amino acid transport system permease protein
MIDSAAIAQFFASGLTTGCSYALVALAIVVIANVSGVVNLAQGEYVAVGGLVLASLTALHVPVVASLPIVAIVGMALASVQEVLTIRPIRNAPHFLQITVTLGVAVAIRGAAFLIWGKDPLGVPGFTGDDVVFLAGAIFPVQAVWVWLGTASLLAVSFYVLAFTQLGRSIRACSINRRAALLMGINPQRTSLLVFAAAGAASTLAGAMLAPITLASWDSGLTPGLKGLIAAIFGGFRSPMTAVIAGLVMGILEAFIAGLGSSDEKDVIFYALMLFGLLVMGGVFARGRDRLNLGSSM